MSKRIKKLPDGELEIMQIIWDCENEKSVGGFVNRAEIDERISGSHKIAQTTLLTILSRLSEKGFVEIRKQGRVSVYRSLVKKEKYLSVQSKDFVSRLCGGSMSVFAAALCDSGLSEEDIEELRRLLKENK